MDIWRLILFKNKGKAIFLHFSSNLAMEITFFTARLSLSRRTDKTVCVLRSHSSAKAATSSLTASCTEMPSSTLSSKSTAVLLVLSSFPSRCRKQVSTCTFESFQTHTGIRPAIFSPGPCAGGIPSFPSIYEVNLNSH